MNRRWHVCLLVAILAPLLGSCGDKAEHITGPFGDKVEQPETDDLGSVSGTVVNTTGAPLPFVQVTIGTQTGFADDLGRFFVAGVELDQGIIRFDKDTRTTTNFRALHLVAGGEVHFPEVMLLPLERGAVFYASEGGTATLGTLGSGATFADSSFTDGVQIYLDRVGAFMALATSDQAHFAAAFPGDFIGFRTDGSTAAMDVLGVIWTFIDSSAGQLQLAPGKTVTYRLGVDPDSQSPPPATVLVFSLDLESGRWDEVGEAELVAGVYASDVAAIAPVCWAVPATDQCAVSGVVQDNQGNPLENTRVECRDLAGRFRQAAMTLADGSFSLEVSRADSVRVAPFFGSIAGASTVVNTVVECPSVLAEPLTITLPDYRIDLAWNQGHGDLDCRFDVADEWVIDYVRRGTLGTAPYAMLEADIRDGGDSESITGRRWYDGTTAYWVHDYEHRDTEMLRSSGARVDLVINEETWSFPVADASYTEADPDSSGWWHVFDIRVHGTEVLVVPVQRFEPATSRD
jgi:hypothetical protein